MKKIHVEMLNLSLVVLSFVGGWFGYAYINQVSAQADWGLLWILGVVVVTIAAAVIGLFLNVILHEGGHLLMGLLTGYKFVFYNVFNIAVVRENGKLAIKNMALQEQAAAVCCLRLAELLPTA